MSGQDNAQINDKCASAFGFYVAYTLLKTELEAGLREGISKKVLLIPAVAVNGAFSCEMFLKALMSETHRGHSLSSLFRLLKPTTAETIRKKVMSRSSVILTHADFDATLDSQSDLFVQWRYVHEYDHSVYKLDFMHALVESLHEFAIENDLARNAQPDY